ncbi:YfiR family protein [Serratia rhizosphaerae]|uniref:YfiR family protein n=1 Tax=Serratia rhizosphaerae TaxID=2597702 RepID=A0ABX6GK80_9GAMM|nr:YfiR family protein [Serratia rhizosphaerae]MEB6334851.1 YfiR family protein [Serratia rhizosphaerae]QHA86694.1 YfiR family protein [Serratia rhizosphaerae]
MKRSKHAGSLTHIARGSFRSLFFSRPYLLGLLLLLSFGGRTATENAEQVQSRTQAVTTVVLGIISYTRWSTPPNPVRLCVTAQTRYADGLFSPLLLEAPHPIKTQRLPLDSNILSQQCDVIYLGDVSNAQRRALIPRIAGHSILVISENDTECSAGSAFCLQPRGKQIGFKVNLDALARSGVRVHPNVLQLARKLESS